MEFFIPRKLKFKAWNTETKLLMRLHHIECVRGELTKKGSVLLQFTGLHDKQHEEIYDMDILLNDSKKYVVCWEQAQNTWSLRLLPEGNETTSFSKHFAMQSIRLCSWFESNG